MLKSKHSFVGRNKPVQGIARIGVSGKHLPNLPETPPRAMRLDGLIPAYAIYTQRLSRVSRIKYTASRLIAAANET